MSTHMPTQCDCYVIDGPNGFLMACPLHAAAPALLEALEALVNEDAPASCCDAGTKARAAIARAKGENKTS